MGEGEGDSCNQVWGRGKVLQGSEGSRDGLQAGLQRSSGRGKDHGWNQVRGRGEVLNWLEGSRDGL